MIEFWRHKCENLLLIWDVNNNIKPQNGYIWRESQSHINLIADYGLDTPDAVFLCIAK